MNYHNKKFVTISNSENGETSLETIFEYKQKGNILTSEYKGGEIVSGHLIGIVDSDGIIEMHYHQINKKGEIRTGICNSRPEIDKDGKIILHENWEWTSGELSSGNSILKEI